MLFLILNPKCFHCLLQNQKTKEQIENLLQNGKHKELRDRLCCRLTFGTAGLRSAMGAGFCYINDLTVIQSTQVSCRLLIRSAPFSSILLSHRALFFSLLIVQYWGPSQLMCCSVYWENGAQIKSPHDKEIIKCIEECVEPWNGSWNENLVDTSPLRQDPLKKICDSYMEDLKKICYHRELNMQTNLKFVHTSFHGVGHDYVQWAFKAFGFQPPIPVPEQKDPDPDFSTVKCPNPEEGESVLELSLRLAERENAKVVVATDPDADRLAVAEQQNGCWKVFTGNELAALFGWWMFSRWKENCSKDADVKNVYMLATTVSSKILRAIALKEGFNFEETLPGFKWIGSRVKDLLDNGKEVLFAFEESIGFMCGTSVLDKDGVSAAVVIAEMAAYLETKNLSLAQKLIEVYETYGYHISKTSYFLCYDPPTIKRIFERLRNFDGPQSYPKFCGDYSILHVRDITTGYDSSQPNKKSVLPVSKSSQMITFTFQNGCVATLRTSGTEPKIKYYAEMCALPEQRSVAEGSFINLIAHFF
uniref:Phosphoglucomutase 2 like 1 n=1 Tax=Chrysolophus pictus TaxID=9089 RepID=A0A8C3LSU2_CHRPC